MLEREYARERALEARRADLENLAKQRSKISAQQQQRPLHENGSDEDDPEIREITQYYFKHLEEEDQQQHKETSSHRL